MAMTSRERALRALRHQEADRIPIDFAGTLVTGITRAAYGNLARHMGYPSTAEEADIFQDLVAPDERMARQFGNDFCVIKPDAPLGWTLEISTSSEGSFFKDEWGIEYRKPPNGLYYDVFRSPLRDSTTEDLKSYPWPDGANTGRTKTIGRRAKQAYDDTDYCITVNDGHWGVMCHGAFLTGFERFYTSLMDDVTFAESVLDRTLEYDIGYWGAILKEAKDYIHVAQIGDDLGNQWGPNVGVETYRKIIKPRHRALIDHIKKNSNAKVFFHSCGAVSDFIPHFIDIGVDILNPVQVSAAGMDTKKLKKEYGKDLSFWGGGCDTQHVLPKGTAKEVREEVLNRMADLGGGGGFIFCAVHNIQGDVPPQNIKTMFETVLEHGAYPLR